jgi:predicted RNase H-like nuclease (RuvC/YqgF family)
MKNIIRVSLLSALTIPIGGTCSLSGAAAAEQHYDGSIIESEVLELRRNVPELKRDIPELKRDVPELKRDIPELKRNVPELKRDIPELKPN